ncbi:MAG: tRNA guanosine(34) transglycosylase Tgt [Hymenobacteraceae bacterium]|nr:tRNA guanosine(34) transglycosylase Tgt [Hymenobacteraceae bacterium]
MPELTFDLHHTDPATGARVGELTTSHGRIQTPIFMPVGTVGTVKGVHQRELTDDVQAQIILGNTYHLYLRPGMEIMRAAGGLHDFNGWTRPVLTDSGGYQVFSLANTRKLTEEGCTFRSHLDGSKHVFTPESVMDTQRIIGADIMMAFDECPPWPCTLDYATKSLALTERWLDRCIARFDATEALYGHYQSLFPIVQGSTDEGLRRRAAEHIASLGRAGNAIGGLSVGEPAEAMYDMTELVCGILPKDKPRYLMGVGTPANLLESIARGIDMFDCVLPTRNARHGILYTTQGILNITNAKWKADFSPLDAALGGYASTFYSKAYVRHLFHATELLGPQIASIHNLTFYLWLVGEARRRILDGTFGGWKAEMVVKLMQRL